MATHSLSLHFEPASSDLLSTANLTAVTHCTTLTVRAGMKGTSDRTTRRSGAVHDVQ